MSIHYPVLSDKTTRRGGYPILDTPPYNHVFLRATQEIPQN